MNSFSFGRRNFINKMALGTAGAISIPSIVLSAIADDKPRKISLNTNDVILFQGDSITDAGRNRNELSPNKGLGNGYSFMTAAELLTTYPTKNLTIYNRGISGNKVYQLAERWEQDAIALKPNVVSILIGVNDYWHLLKSGYKGTLEIYRNDYRALLKQTREKLPNAKFVIAEPFAILGSAVDNKWFPAFGEYQQTAKELAIEFDAVFVPFQKVFDKALKVAPGTYWAPDGVHPSIAGAKLMAETWLEVIRG